MVAGDKDVAFIINAGGFNMNGYTATLLAAPGRLTPGNGLSLTPLAISEDGLTATYVTTGTDFTQSGPWQVQLQVAIGTDPTVQLYTSPPGQLYISPRL